MRGGKLLRIADIENLAAVRWSASTSAGVIGFHWRAGASSGFGRSLLLRTAS